MLTSRARRRHERGLERAEEIVDRTANKLAKSKQSARNIDTRKKAWDEINASAAGEKGMGMNKFASLMGAQDDDDDDDESDGAVELDDEMEDAQQAKAGKVARGRKATAPAPAAPPPQDDGDDDEIL